MNTLKMYTKDLLDPETEIHYAFHKTIKNITIEHYHDFYEVFLITKGEVVHMINSKRQLLSEGAFVFMRPDDVHYFARNENSDCKLINLAFPHKTIQAMFEYLGSGFSPERLLSAEMPPQTILSKAEVNIVKSQLEELNTLPRKRQIEIKTRVRILLVNLFAKYFPVKHEAEKKTIPPWLDWLVNEMHKKENFSGGLQTMQKLSHRSPEHLARIFRKNLKVTPTQFVNELRLNYAANLLVNTDEQIADIAMESGFENLSHFYHQFNKQFKQPPKQYRLLNKKSVIPE